MQSEHALACSRASRVRARRPKMPMMRPTRSITGRPSAALRLRSCSGRSVSLTNTAHGVASLAVPCLPLPPPPPPPLVAPPMPSLAKPQLALLLIAPLTALPRLPSALSLPLASVTPSPPAAAVLPAACGASAAAMRSRNSCIAPVPKNAGLPDRDTRLWPTVATPIGPPHGVGMLLAPEWGDTLIEEETLSQQLIRARFQADRGLMVTVIGLMVTVIGLMVTVIGVYAPTEGTGTGQQQRPEVVDLYAQITDWVIRASRRRYLFTVAGDFNTAVGRGSYSTYPCCGRDLPFGEPGAPSPSGRILLETATARLANTCFKHPVHHQYT
eukprot:355429-Chlamydomonas_euryale.AAC.2